MNMYLIVILIGILLKEDTKKFRNFGSIRYIQLKKKQDLLTNLEWY